MSDQCTEERFLKDASAHEMSIIRDDGTSRHIRFKKPGTSSYFFDLITWPGHLCVSGDCGTYVFRRLDDMFEFFRTDRDYGHKKGQKLYINTGYWAEKVVSESRDGKIQEFSEEIFRKVVKEYFDDHFKEEIDGEESMRVEASEENPLNPDELLKMEEAAEKRAAIWEEIEERLLSGDGDVERAAYDFDCEGFQFQDFFEHNFKEYTFRFVWNLYAIAWGIEKYDNLKAAMTPAEEVAT